MMMSRITAAILVISGIALTPQTASAAQATMLGAGHVNSCALTTAGGVLCWGANTYGQLGDGSRTDSNVPVAVTGLSSNVSSIATGLYHSCALLNNGAVQCWGYNGVGQMGIGKVSDYSPPVQVSNLSGVVAIGVGMYHSCAVLATGQVKCWGNGSDGQLGNGGGGSLIPVDVLGVSGAKSLALGSNHTCAALSNRKVQCWGNNQYGQLGNGTTTGSRTRVDVTGLTDATAITAGLFHTCVRTSAGTAKCWGMNSSGQLGNGATTNATSPVAVTGLSGVTQIHSSSYAAATCAVASGGAKCWGANDNYQLGNGNNVNQALPSAVTGLAGAASAIAIGTNHACAIVKGGVQCWGNNTYGQHGAGNLITPPFPQNTVNLFGSAPAVTPQAISPVTSNTPVYTWKAVPGATSYNLRINGMITNYTAAQANCPDGVGLCTRTDATLAPGSHSWQVQPVNSYGNGNWSALLQFTL
ncbi:hypothetical protein V8J88_17625 [Massilia sp. W12]|uniref:RCC1 domain-containing protein n=1 Tax=Massilia sp. W12 TaxID=3126507 RepID=UPI0030D45EAC